MKRIILLAVTIIVVVAAVTWIAATPSETGRDTESANLKVLKVYSANFGEGRFQAYMVNWKGQEVIVDDPLVKTDLHEGDTLPVLMIRNKYPNDKPGPDLVHFTVRWFPTAKGQ